VLASVHRMRRSGDFVSTVRGGGRHGSPLVVAYAAAHPGDERVVGLVVSKMVGNSVVRHRVTRRLRAIMAGHLPAVPRGTGVVVRALPGAASADYQRLLADVTRCVDKAIRKA
jgi:ribonuclease P protein component